MVTIDNARAAQARLTAYLDEKGFTYKLISHPVVLTVDEQEKHVGGLSGALAKNLLLKDKKGRLILISALTTTKVDLKLLSQRMGLGKGGLRMAPPENLAAVLQVPEGCVTPLAVFNQSARDVSLLLDKGFCQHERLLFHPLSNDATIEIERADFDALLRQQQREPHYVDLEAVVAVGKDQPPDLAEFLLAPSSSSAGNGDGTSSQQQEPATASTSNGATAAAAKIAGPSAAPKASGGSKEAKKSAAAVERRGPPGGDVATCAQTVVSLAMERLAAASAAAAAPSAAAAAPSAATPAGEASEGATLVGAEAEQRRLDVVRSQLLDEVKHVLVLFKNAAYTEGFTAARTSAKGLW